MQIRDWSTVESLGTILGLAATVGWALIETRGRKVFAVQKDLEKIADDAALKSDLNGLGRRLDISEDDIKVLESRETAYLERIVTLEAELLKPVQRIIEQLEAMREVDRHHGAICATTAETLKTIVNTIDKLERRIDAKT